MLWSLNDSLKSQKLLSEIFFFTFLCNYTVSQKKLTNKSNFLVKWPLPLLQLPLATTAAACNNWNCSHYNTTEHNNNHKNTHHSHIRTHIHKKVLLMDGKIEVQIHVFYWWSRNNFWSSLHQGIYVKTCLSLTYGF